MRLTADVTGMLSSAAAALFVVSFFLAGVHAGSQPGLLRTFGAGWLLEMLCRGTGWGFTAGNQMKEVNMPC